MGAEIDILLVDDEPRNLDALESILSDPSYNLLRAEDADKALHILLKVDVAAIVLDIKMPGVNGLELAHMIKSTKRFQRTPIVLLTAYLLEEQHVIAGYGAGAVDYLVKPVNPEILRQKVAVFADLYRKTRELDELNNSLEERVKERTAELLRSETALRAAAAQKDEFLAVLAHELRNPLAPLRTGLDILLRRNSQDPITSRSLGAMDRQLDHMVRLIDDLLDISRLSRGLLELKMESVDLAEIVEATLDGCRSLFQRRRQELSFEVPGGIRTRGDPTRISQILTNLLNNAAKFTPEDGRVKVELEDRGADAVVRVSDSGVGVPADQLERIFDMFTRIDRGGSAAQPGLGIGLALARRLAEMHGGSLTVSSAGAGRGATFELSLPLLPVPEAATRGDREPGQAAEVPGLKVLVIEDNRDVLETMSELLRELGHDVWEAGSGRRGVDLAEEIRPDLVLCDLGLPDTDGIEVCRQIRVLPSDRPQPFMVALTGWGRDEDRALTRLAGFDHHLVKPIKYDQLRGVLERVMPGAQVAAVKG